MSILHFYFLNSIWLGLLTSFTPCVICAGLTILSYITQKTKDKKQMALYVASYALGRAVFYTIVSLIINLFVDNIDSAKLFLVNRANIVIGIIMIFVSLVLIDLINIDLPKFNIVEKIKRKTGESKYFSSFLFGILFAGMFCPVTASLFLSNFLNNQSISSSFFYGISTAFFVLILAFIMIFFESKFQIFEKNIELIKHYSSKVTGIIFFLMGIGLIFKLF